MGRFTNGIKSRADKRNAERVSNETDTRKQLDGFLAKAEKRLYSDVDDWIDTVWDLVENGFNEELDTILDEMANEYGVITGYGELNTGDANYLNYRIQLGGGYDFVVGVWQFINGNNVDFAVCKSGSDDLFWYKYDTEESTQEFLNVAKQYVGEIMELVDNTYLPYFSELISWANEEFGE